MDKNYEIKSRKHALFILPVTYETMMIFVLSRMTACLVTQKEIIIDLLSLAELPSIDKQTRCLHLVNKH